MRKTLLLVAVAMMTATGAQAQGFDYETKHEVAVSYGFNQQQPKDMQYFRFEVFGNYGAPVLGLSELIFNYDD